MTGRLVQAAPTVPFLDLAPSSAEVSGAILGDVAELLRSGAFTNGPQVAAFEDSFAAYSGVPLCVGTGSGLDALRFALIAAGIEPGDEVIVPANTFVATFEAVTQAGGVPVPVDVSLDDLNMDVDAAAAAASVRSRFVLPVHLYGQMADMRALRGFAERRGLLLVEDACQAHGAERDGLRAGAVGIASAFSFYPGKNLGAFGDAGALVTSSHAIAARTKSLREHGQSSKYHHEIEGWTSRLDTIQAIVLLHKLSRLDDWNRRRREVAAFYSEALAGVGDIELPNVPSGSDPVWHLFVVETDHREAVSEFLAARGVHIGRHYPQPVHLSAAYAGLGHPRGSLPITGD